MKYSFFFFVFLLKSHPPTSVDGLDLCIVQDSWMTTLYAKSGIFLPGLLSIF